MTTFAPMRRVALNPELRTVSFPSGSLVESWENDEYEAVVAHYPNGWAYIGLYRHDEQAVRDWGVLQSIKNQTVGPEREAFELFPAESRLMDETNAYHLWVIPKGQRIAVGNPDRLVAEDRER